MYVLGVGNNGSHAEEAILYLYASTHLGWLVLATLKSSWVVFSKKEVGEVKRRLGVTCRNIRQPSTFMTICTHTCVARMQGPIERNI